MTTEEQDAQDAKDEHTAAAPETAHVPSTPTRAATGAADTRSDDAQPPEEEEEEEDTEPKLKYSRLTGHLGPVYRNGDATSSALVAGDKMVHHPTPPGERIVGTRIC
jgi:hypothetical protein